MSAVVDDKTLQRVRLWGGLAASLMAAGFVAALFLVTHYASAADVQRLGQKLEGVSGKETEHDAKIESIKDDVRYIRDALDALREDLARRR
jgi:hypothetical protein